MSWDTIIASASQVSAVFCDCHRNLELLGRIRMAGAFVQQN